MTPDKLRALADRIDHEKLWQKSFLDQMKLTRDQRDRLEAAIELRRWADAKKPGRWLIIPPEGPVQFGASTLDAAVTMVKRHLERSAARERKA